MPNNNLNRMVKNPITLNMGRSRFNKPYDLKTTLNSGVLVPIYVDEVLPGDTFNVKTDFVVRSLTPVVPVMDNAYIDIYHFFVPSRLCTVKPTDWQEIHGENINGYWAARNEKTLSNTGNTRTLNWLINSNEGKGIEPGSVANYMGLPVIPFNSATTSRFNEVNISLLPFVGYVKIWNDFFRDENNMIPVDEYEYISGRLCAADGVLPVCKVHDVYTSSLPQPQKGESVLLPLGEQAPVITSSSLTNDYTAQLKFVDNNNDSVEDNVLLRVDSGSGLNTYEDAEDTFIGHALMPSNLYADLSNATAASINQLRMAFAIQRLLERDARGGTRYYEMLKAHFGVTVPDLTLQRPEYLGGKRIPLNMNQVLQTSSTDNISPLGSTGAFSNTGSHDNGFIKSFNEYGYIISVACIRTEQSYSQGIPKMFSRDRRFDFYYPSFANIGEMPLMTKELYISNGDTGVLTNTEQVFGYQEAWYDYRFKPNMVTGYFAPNANDLLLTPWTYALKLSTTPILNQAFLVQSKDQIADTLVSSDSPYQFLANFYFRVDCTRPMPLFSIPGLIDHN